MGASKLRRPKEVAAVTDPKDAGQGDSLKLMEFAYRMGRDSLSSSSAAAPATSKPAEAAGPVFPPLQDGLVTAEVSSDAEPKTTPAAEVLSFQKACSQFVFFRGSMLLKNPLLSNMFWGEA